MATDLAKSIAPLAFCGWLGQACFFARFLLQWVASERARRSVVPRGFWWLSLGGSVLMTGYAIWRREPVLLSGFLVGGTIAARNLWLENHPRARIDARWLAIAAALFLGALFLAELRDAPFRLDQPRPWLFLGVLGQTLWVARFPVQWCSSERTGQSHFPVAFWWLSLAGNLLLLSYALQLGELVFVLGFLPGPLVQVRNLWLASRFPLER